MTKLATAGADVSAAQSAFLASCAAHGFANEWAAYRAEMHAPWPVALRDAHAALVAAERAFYGLRDGPRGFLGGRGA